MRNLLFLIFFLLPFEESNNFIAQFGTPIRILGLGLIPFILSRIGYLYQITGYILTIVGIYMLWFLNNINNLEFIITISGNLLLFIGTFLYVKDNVRDSIDKFKWLSYWYILISFLNAFELLYSNEVHDDRLFFFNTNPNDYSLFLLFAFLVVRKNTSKRFLQVTSLFVVAWLIYLTKSRFAMSVVALVIAYDFRRYYALGLLVLILFFYQLNFNVISDNFRLSNRDDLMSFGGRTDIWNTFISLEFYKSLFGESVSSISQKMTLLYDRNRRFHNSFLDIYASAGLIGVLLWSSLWKRLVVGSWKFYTTLRYGSFLLPLVLVILGISLKSGSLYGFKFLWINLGIIIGILTCDKKESVYFSR